LAEWHSALRNALERELGVLSELPGDGYRVAATWEIRRRSDGARFMIDFDGLTDDGIALPSPESYGCRVRSAPSISLCFSRKGVKGSKRRATWKAKLTGFLSDLKDLRTESDR